MSKRNRVPGPFFRNMPSVVRTSLPRFVFIATAAVALLILGGGSYVLSRATPTPAKTTPKPLVQPTTASPQAQAAVLGDTTDQSSSSTPAPGANTPASASSASSATTSGASSPASQPSPASASVSTTPQQTDVTARTPVGSLLLNLPLGI